MNGRCFVKTQNQWILIPAAEGPFHRQYRHQQHLYRDRPRSAQQRYRDAKNAEERGVTHTRAQFRKLSLAKGRYDRGHTFSRRQHCSADILFSQSDMIRRDGIDLSFTTPGEQKARHESFAKTNGHRANQSELLATRLLWFRTNHAQRPKVVTLIDRFDSAGMNIQVLDIVQEGGFNETHFNCALIMLECVEVIEQEMLARLDQVRAFSNAPLIVLTDNATLDWSLLALREGADAIFTLNTPDEVILARSTALLRRWHSD